MGDSSLDIGFANLDLAREARTGCAEVVYAPGKTADQLAEIFSAFAERSDRAFATRAVAEQAQAVQKRLPDAEYDPISRILKLERAKIEPIGMVAVCCGGTGDLPVALEAAQTATFFGSRVEMFNDVGVAGLHRLTSKIEAIRRANAAVAVAGMEGALASVLGGLVDVPVVAVPTSVGYGASFSGLAPLLAMLNSCAAGVTVVNIDNGFGAGYAAGRINRLIEGKR